MSQMKSIHTRLVLAGRASRKAAEKRAEAARELEAAIDSAIAAGMKKTEIAEVAGINRVTVYKILEGKGK